MMPDAGLEEDNSVEIQTLSGRNVLTRSLNTKELSRSDVQELDQRDMFSGKQQQRPWRVALTIVDSNILLAFDVTGSIIIGRSYPSSAPFNGIDLSPFNAYELGLSRDHAILQLHNNSVTISDNGSTNGTYLNDKRLKPNTNYILREGDYVTLGGLAMRFDLLYHPWT